MLVDEMHDRRTDRARGVIPSVCLAQMSLAWSRESASSRRAPSVHTKNSIRPTSYIIWRGKVMDLARPYHHRLAIEARVRAEIEDCVSGQVSK